MELEIESPKAWKTAIEYELTLVEIMLHNFAINYSEGKEHISNLILNLVSSVSSLSITTQFMDSLKECGKYLFTIVYEKVSYPKEVYFIYYYF